jgi:hypothetical protein
MVHFYASRRILFSAALLSAFYDPCAQTLASNNEPNRPQISIGTKYVKISLTVVSALQDFTELFAADYSGDRPLNACAFHAKRQELRFDVSLFALWRRSLIEGPYTVFVPWTAFRQYLSSQGAALFGGERPKSDEEKW